MFPCRNICFGQDLSEAKVRAACTARLGMPLTGQMLTGTLPFYPSLPAIESEGPEHEDMPLDTISELHATPAPHESQVSIFYHFIDRLLSLLLNHFTCCLCITKNAIPFIKWELHNLKKYTL